MIKTLPTREHESTFRVREAGKIRESFVSAKNEKLKMTTSIRKKEKKVEGSELSSSLCVSENDVLIRASDISRVPDIWNLRAGNQKLDCALKIPDSDDLDVRIPIVRCDTQRRHEGAISTRGVACTWILSETNLKRNSKAVLRDFCTKHGGVTDFDCRRNSLAMVCSKNAAVAIYDTRSTSSLTIVADDGDTMFQGKHFLSFGETEYDLRIVTQNGICSVFDTRSTSRAKHSLSLGTFLNVDKAHVTSCRSRGLFNMSSLVMIGSSEGDAALLEFKTDGIQIVSSSRNLHDKTSPAIRSITPLGTNAILTCDDIGRSHLWAWTDDDDGVSLLRHQETFVESSRIHDVAYVPGTGSLAFSCEGAVKLNECRLNNECIPWECAVY